MLLINSISGGSFFLKQQSVKQQRITLTLNNALTTLVDKAAKLEYTGRSDFIRQAIVEKLRNQAELVAITVPDDDQALEEAFQRINKERFKRRFRAANPDIKKYKDV